MHFIKKILLIETSINWFFSEISLASSATRKLKSLLLNNDVLIPFKRK